MQKKPKKNALKAEKVHLPLLVSSSSGVPHFPAALSKIIKQ